MDQTLEKASPSLGRDAVYSQKSRVTRLPANLVVHMVRFAWKRDINKKAKIMRKVCPFRFAISVACCVRRACCSRLGAFTNRTLSPR